MNILFLEIHASKRLLLKTPPCRHEHEHKCLLEPFFSFHTVTLRQLAPKALTKFLEAIEHCSPRQKVGNLE